ncbi:Cyclin-like [Sesbania bispinosa]|nr:Cyclin-like [Sesbania bispinosa]
MSVSPTLDLYCSETTSDVVQLDSDDAGLNVPWGYSDGDETCLLSLLDSELDQLQEKTKSLGQLRKKTWLMNAREEAINWILKQEKAWPLQLLSVACLALAAKMEEIKVPLLLDLQVIEPGFVFKPKTVQRMELLVMASLKWRLRTITPFDFAYLFIAKLPCSASTLGDLDYIVSHVSDVIIRTCLVMDFSEFPPSTIAAAALLLVSNQNVGDQKSGCIHKNISIEMVQKCYNLMKQKQIIRRSEQFWPKNLQLLPLSPTCVLDHAAMQESSDAHKP